MPIKTDETTNLNTGASSTTPPISNAQPTEGKNEHSVPTGRSFAEIIQSASLASASSAACRAYVENLYKACERLNLKVEAVVTGSVDAQVVSYPDPDSKYAIALIFAGSTGIAKRPVSDKESEVSAAFNNHNGFGDYKVVKSFVVDETSYDYPEVMAVCIYNTLRTMIDEDKLVLNEESFIIDGCRTPLVVSTKADVYRDYVRRVSPFGFSERDDIGFLVGIPRRNCPPTDKFNISSETHHILFAVTGYTQFVRIENQMAYGSYNNYNQAPKTIRPIVHITSIVSQTPSIVLLPAAITIAAKVFIAHRNWRKPYLSINGKESMNVGNLVLNVDPATGARSTVDAETAFQAEEAMNATCEEPILALDITQGRDGIPGIECMLGMRDEEGKRLVLASVLNRFYKGKVKAEAYNIETKAGLLHEYTGLVMLDNEARDSRSADYLRMFRKIGDYGQVATLLSQPNDPAMRLQQLQDFGLTVKSLYNTTSVILSRDCIMFMADLCPSYEVDLTNDARFNYAFNGIEAAAGIGSLNLPTFGTNDGYNFGMNNPYRRW